MQPIMVLLKRIINEMLKIMFTCDILTWSKIYNSKIFLGGISMANLSNELFEAMIYDSYEAWKSILQKNPQITQVLKCLECCGHLSERLREIRRGLEHDLTLEQIKIYARPEFDYSQMSCIRFGLEAGFTQEQLGKYARTEFSGNQMAQIAWGYRMCLTEEQISEYADPNLDADEMEDIRWKYMTQLTEEQIQACRAIAERKSIRYQNKIDSLKALIDNSK